MKVDHIGIATTSIKDAAAFWSRALGAEISEPEEVADQFVRVAMLPVGESRIELLEPTNESSPVAKFLERRGPGIHHVALRVPDIRVALEQLQASGARLIDAEPRLGADGCLIAFIHPSATGGVLVELVEHIGQE
jgi:methylmalonyl-CoA/ethylmalonyl-CoA epimerase